MADISHSRDGLQKERSLMRLKFELARELRWSLIPIVVCVLGELLCHETASSSYYRRVLLEPFLLDVAANFVLWFLFRAIARLVLNQFWNKWYIRRAIDASFVGFLVLGWMAFTPEWGRHYSSEQRSIGDKLSLMRAAGYPNSKFYVASENVWHQYCGLSFLMDNMWFVDNFGSFVVLPAFVVLCFGYAMERNKHGAISH
ncbi:MAG TPA: hypothetical protein V6C81_20675 [Planktothrix sp.]|jgi:hypothetical protein